MDHAKEDYRQIPLIERFFSSLETRHLDQQRRARADEAKFCERRTSRSLHRRLTRNAPDNQPLGAQGAHLSGMRQLTSSTTIWCCPALGNVFSRGNGQTGSAGLTSMLATVERLIEGSNRPFSAIEVSTVRVNSPSANRRTAAARLGNHDRKSTRVTLIVAIDKATRIPVGVEFHHEGHSTKAAPVSPARHAKTAWQRIHAKSA